MEEQIKKLELKITELENQLKQAGLGAQANIDPKDMEIFRKVSGQLGFDPDSVCGINECRPVSVCRVCTTCRVCSVCTVCSTCVVCRVCKPCIVECSCGPCILSGGGLSHNIDRFNDFG